VVTYFVDADKLSGLLPSIMSKLSLFQRFETFVDGMFDMTALVYFASVIIFFLFLTVQSLEKRRYN
jgi:ABC-2 type transport system permease protein